MNTIILGKGKSVTTINEKWKKRFEADGWRLLDDDPEIMLDDIPEKVSGDDIAALIESSESKDDLEALVKDAFGVDLDKRKGLDKLKAEALELVNSNES